jgi:mono/diheme cytochrome c family protein
LRQGAALRKRRIPEVKNVPLTLTASNPWDALGLPLTAFTDGARRGSIRSVTERDFQPFQVSVVRLNDRDGKPVLSGGKPVEFIGTNPVDMPNCFACHSGDGVAAQSARAEGLKRLDDEYEHWKAAAPDTSEFMRRQSQAAIGILELHDAHHDTKFLAGYDPKAANNRLGRSGPVNCPDCHGDNVSGNLQSPRPGAGGYFLARGKPLTEAIHLAHIGFVAMPDKAGRTQSCQACHPTHGQGTAFADPEKSPYRITDSEGADRFGDSDVGLGGGGCYLRRDAHSNPAAEPPFFLNAVGRWMLAEVSGKDERGALRDPARQTGDTLRNRPIDSLVKAVAGGDAKRFRSWFADPLVGSEGDPLRAYSEKHVGATMVRASKDRDGKLVLAAWNAPKGDPVPYDAASAGRDWWLSASEPHCADCHLAPFVEAPAARISPSISPRSTRSSVTRRRTARSPASPATSRSTGCTRYAKTGRPGAWTSPPASRRSNSARTADTPAR